MSSISVQGLRFAYADVPVLDGLDLSLAAGQLLVVIGPSGCGKTTLLRVLAGFERPTAGEVRFGSTVVVGGSTVVPTSQRHVGIVPQEGALFPHLDVRANISFGLPRRSPRREERVRQLLAMVGLEGLGARYPRELSGGQQQRVALARAMASRPEVVLLDEPFASLDRSTRIEVRETMRATLSREGTTAIMVTHDREEALSIADRLAVVVSGRIAQLGTPYDVYDTPATRQVARLLGDASFLPVRCAGSHLTSPLGTLTPRTDSERPAEADRPWAMLRPEQVGVSFPEAGEGTQAVVRVVEFSGPTTRIEAELDDGTTVLASTSTMRPRAGDAVRLSVTSPVHVLTG